MMPISQIRPLVAAVVLAMTPMPAQSQSSAVQNAQIPPQDLNEFEGHYEYRDGRTLFMVLDGGQLVAIIAEAKYRLHEVSADTFANPSGSLIPFLRDANGRIMAFKEHGDTFSRFSSSVPSEVYMLLAPRPPGPDGRLARYHYQQPAQLSDGIDTREAAAGTLIRVVAERLVNGVIDGTYPDVRSILIYHKGALILEEYFYGFDQSRPHEMRSLTKSVISLLVGAAVDRGLLRPDEPALARLGYAAYENPDPRKAKVTVIDLLSNQSGFACDDRDGDSPGNEVKIYEASDWAKAFVDLPVVADPGTVGRYCSAGIITAGRIVEKATGKSLPAFAQEALFESLGIRSTDWKWDFILNPSGRNEFGLYLRPRDMLKLGILIRQRGEWDGRRVVSATWIDEAVARQSWVDESDYGLGIWHRWYGVQASSGGRRVDTIMLSGNGGQKVYLVPSLDLIAVFTGGAFNVYSPVNDMMARVLLPALLENE